MQVNLAWKNLKFSLTISTGINKSIKLSVESLNLKIVISKSTNELEQGNLFNSLTWWPKVEMDVFVLLHETSESFLWFKYFESLLFRFFVSIAFTYVDILNWRSIFVSWRSKWFFIKSHLASFVLFLQGELFKFCNDAFLRIVLIRIFLEFKSFKLLLLKIRSNLELRFYKFWQMSTNYLFVKFL
jgi:hypothetical protein